MDPDCLDRNDDMITAAIAAHAAGRVDDSFKYLERLHKDIMNIASFIDRTDERSMLEGLKSIGNKRKKNMGCVSGSVSGPPPAPFPSMIQGVKSLGMVDQTLVPPLQGTDHLHSFAIPPLPPPAEPILPVCEECRQRKKSKKYCREELKHDAPPWNADKPVKESKRRKKKNKPPVSKSLSLIPTPSVPKALSLKPAPPSLPRANTLLASFLAPSRPLPMPIKHGLNPPSLLPLPVECDEFSDEDLDEDPNGEIHV